MSSIPVPTGAPAGARPGARPEANPSSALALQAAKQNRLFFLLVLAMLGMIAAFVAIIVLLPLKRYDPVVITRDPASGAVQTMQGSTSSYVASDKDIDYFLGNYVMNTFGISRLSTEANLVTARQFFTRGKAVSQFDGIVEKEEPIARLRADPGFTRKVEVTGIGRFKDGALVRATFIDQGSKDGAPKKTKYLITLQFSMIPPAPDDLKLILVNPAGIYFTDLDVKRDHEQ